MADYGDRATLWTKDPPPVSPPPLPVPVSRHRSWLLAAVPVLVLVVLVLVLGVLHAQVRGQLWTVDQRVSDLTAVVQSLNSSLQRRHDVQDLKETVDKNQEQLKTVVDALQQLNEVETVKRSIESLKCSLQHLVNNSSAAGGCCPLGWVQFENDCFLFSSLSLSWNESKVWCEQQQAHLVLLHSDKTWDFVKGRAAPTFFWVGLSDWRTGRWEWVNQTPYTMERRRWVPGQPDNWLFHGQGHEDCAHLHSDGRLNDLLCSTRLHYICQKHSSRG